jgi:hypothetical protein
MLPINHNISFERRDEARQRAEQGCFSRTVRSEKTCELTGTERGRDSGLDTHRTARGEIPGGEIVKFDYRLTFHEKIPSQL